MQLEQRGRTTKGADESPAVAAFWRYTEAFQSLDARAVSQHFHEPALMITPRGVRALPNRAAVENEYAQIMAELPLRRYAKTAFFEVEERVLGDDLVTVSGSGTR